VAALVAALVAHASRSAITPTDLTLAGYTGRYLEWSVPADMRSSAPAEFDACDVVDATYSPDTTDVDRAEPGHVVESLRFVAP
jgi:hypothetical protein